jgi:hypothetical protein
MGLHALHECGTCRSVTNHAVAEHAAGLDLVCAGCGTATRIPTRPDGLPS